MDGRSSLRTFTWYVVVLGGTVIAYQVLPTSACPWAFALIAATTAVPIGLRWQRTEPGTRLPWILLLLAVALMAAGSFVYAADRESFKALSDALEAAGNALTLACALTVLVARGRGDVGGLIDTAVALMAVGSLLWTGLLLPRLTSAHVPMTAQATTLVTIFVLSGVLGAISRLWLVTGRLPSLLLMVCALLLSLVGNVALALTSGSAPAVHPRWIETLHLLAYLCVGATALHPTAERLTQPGSAPADRLSGRRLMFLGAAVVVGPLIGGTRQLLGLPADGLLIAIGAVATAPLVMLRVHRLAVQREAAELALLHQATHDPLTGLTNRAELLSRLAAALTRERLSGRPGVVLLFCDLNGFKAVNDRLGHAAGDRLLVEIAGRLRAGLRAEDTVARYGGDEFLLLCEDGSAETVTRLRAHIHSALSTPIDLDGEPIRIGASVGAVTSDGLADADALIRCADTLMYEAKTQRRRTDRAPAGSATPANAGTVA